MDRGTLAQPSIWHEGALSHASCPDDCLQPTQGYSHAVLSERAKNRFKIKLDPSVIFCSQQFSKLLAIKQSTAAFSPLPPQTQRDNNRNRASYLANYSFQP